MGEDKILPKEYKKLLHEKVKKNCVFEAKILKFPKNATFCERHKCWYKIYGTTIPKFDMNF